MQVNKVFDYDSVMVSEEDLKEGTHRLLEVDNRLLVPIGVPIRFLITATDVLHS
jgi:heme/copper-type cytochrome/quinol oxidase subunit 2